MLSYASPQITLRRGRTADREGAIIPDCCGPLRHFFAAQKTLIASKLTTPGRAHYKDVNPAKKGQKPPKDSVN